MKKYLILILVTLLSACSESGMEFSLMSGNDGCVNIEENEDFVTTIQASEVATLFMTNNIRPTDVETRGNSAFGNSKTIMSIKTIYDENKGPSMYVINYKGGGFVIVSATKTYYPILAYSNNNTMDVEEAMKTGFSIWTEDTRKYIIESGKKDEKTLMKFRDMWSYYEAPKANVTPLNTTDDHYQNGVLFRQRLNELYALCPGYSFGPLSSARSHFLQSEYDGLVEKAKLYGSPLEFTIVGFQSYNWTVNPLINTTWGQESGYNALCPNGSPAGCVAIAMAQIMKYHKWPQTYNWDNMPNSNATFATQTLIADIGKAVGMDYGKDESGASIDDAKRGFESMGYVVSKNKYNVTDVEREIRTYKHPVYMRGDRKNFIGISWKGHAWVCEGAYEYTTCGSYFVEYLINRSTNPSYSSCGIPAYWAPQSSSGWGQKFLYMNWGWYGQYNGWFGGDSVNPTEDRNYQYDRENLYVSPQK